MTRRVMKTEEDAYGQEIWTYYDSGEGLEIVERDDGYIDASPTPRIYFSKYEDWAAHEKKAMEFANGRILDLGCGAGRHSLYLQEKGFDVLGIDVSPLAVRVCRLKGFEESRSHFNRGRKFPAKHF